MNDQERYIKLNWQQQYALDCMLAGQNVFLTGKAGTGKSAVINRLVSQSPKHVVKLAPTGVAAQNIGGSTVHSFFQLPIPFADPERLKPLKPECADIIKAADIIIIDEVSFLRSEGFQFIDARLRSLAPKEQRHLSMGGKQLIVVGDFLQLPAFAREPEIKQHLNECYGGLQAFNAPAWQEANFNCIELDSVFRQRDSFYLEILNAIREGNTDFYDYEFGIEGSHLGTLNNTCYRYNRAIDYDEICLCLTKAKTAEINNQTLAGIKGSEVSFKGEVRGAFPKDALPVEQNLKLKIGARVMVRVNACCLGSNRPDYVNGDIGTVVDIYQGQRPSVEVKLDWGLSVLLKPNLWIHHEYSLDANAKGKTKLIPKVVGTYEQMPLSLAWAVSVHKSQGLTLPKAHLILGDRPCFCPGQLYVALSRVPALECLTIDRPVTEHDVIVDRDAMEFYSNIRCRNQSPAGQYCYNL